MNNVQETTLSVPDMSCNHCVQTINQALGKLEGVEQVETNLEQKKVHVRYQTATVSLSQITAVLDDAGYTVVA